jgi:HEAT repeat protein
MTNKLLSSIAMLASLLSGPAAVCLQPSPLAEVIYPSNPEGADDPAGKAYADGTRAINEARWADAAAIFGKLAGQGGDRADAALYWKAYAENKEGQQARALETCAELGHAHAKSRWVSECDVLRIEIRGASGSPVQAQTGGDDELKLLALNALMQQDEARAMPTIQQILNGNGSERLKEKALFVLANSNSPEAQNAIGQIARGQSNPQLQIRAIRMYAAIKGKRSVDTLADIYQHSSDEGVKRAILQSYLVTGSPEKLVEAARGEQNPVLARTAVQSLGAMGATSELSTLYRDTKSQETKSAIIGSLVAAGSKGAEMLGNIANSEQDPELRRKAIRNLGATGGASAAPALLSTYQNSKDVESKKAAVDGLFISGDARDLVALARAEKNPELKQAIVSKLSVMHSKESTDYMMEILNK